LNESVGLIAFQGKRNVFNSLKKKDVGYLEMRKTNIITNHVRISTMFYISETS
jgi:hypothetical protein